MRPLLWLGLALAAGGALAVSWLPEDDLAEPLLRADSAQRPLAAARPERAASAAAMLATRESWPGLAAAARGAWSPPPKPVPAAPPPAPPAPPAPPPPFPYQWLGQLQDGGQTRFFLGSPQQTLAVNLGDTVDGRWRVEGSDAGRLRLTWLPTGSTVFVGPRGSSPNQPDPA